MGWYDFFARFYDSSLEELYAEARFEAAEATSTRVTFHTPPYAALEQYVKTYPQGPWTDIYALGVVLYECVTGQKPPEVLERMHGGLGERLSDGKWPGYPKKFLAAIDATLVDGRLSLGMPPSGLDAERRREVIAWLHWLADCRADLLQQLGEAGECSIPWWEFGAPASVLDK